MSGSQVALGFFSRKTKLRRVIIDICRGCKEFRKFRYVLVHSITGVQAIVCFESRHNVLRATYGKKFRCAHCYANPLRPGSLLQNQRRPTPCDFQVGDEVPQSHLLCISRGRLPMATKSGPGAEAGFP